MGGGTAWNMYSVCKNKWIKKRYILLFVIWKNTSIAVSDCFARVGYNSAVQIIYCVKK